MTRSLREAAAGTGSAAQRFWSQGLCDALDFFLIVSRVQIPSPYSRHEEGKNGKPRKHSICSRKIKAFPEIPHLSLYITAQNSITWPPLGAREIWKSTEFLNQC